MKTSLCFLLAARRSEISALQQVLQTSALVRSTASAIHALQRERGLSNLFTGSAGQAYAAQRQEQLAETDVLIGVLRSGFDELNTEPTSQYTRLFSRIAYAVHKLDTLDRLRGQVSSLTLSPTELSAGYAKVIASMMGVVFEAADMASDPGLSKLLVALFNFMQGKELAGQERAAGAAMFAAGESGIKAQQHLRHLIESQDKCLRVFESFADPDLLQLWHHCRSAQVDAERERLRRLLCQQTSLGEHHEDISRTWFACASQRIDEMRLVEDQLTKVLIEKSQRRLSVVCAEVAQIEAMQLALGGHDTAAGLHRAEHLFTDALTEARIGPALEKSVVDLVQQQAYRLQCVEAELETVKASLSERKLIERAKGLLMAHQQLREDEAHKTLRDLAMRENKRMIDVAEAVLSMASLFKLRP